MNPEIECRRSAGLLKVSVCLLPVIVAFGCGASEMEVHPVQGQVVVDGRPVANAHVILHPQSADGVAGMLKPRGRTAQDGFFELTTFEPSDGSPAGEYLVTITWPGPAADAEPDDDEAILNGPDQLGGRYADPSHSQMKVVVVEGRNELEPFRLRR